jgi:hypothetical protein
LLTSSTAQAKYTPGKQNVSRAPGAGPHARAEPRQAAPPAPRSAPPNAVLRGVVLWPSPQNNQAAAASTTQKGCEWIDLAAWVGGAGTCQGVGSYGWRGGLPNREGGIQPLALALALARPLAFALARSPVLGEKKKGIKRAAWLGAATCSCFCVLAALLRFARPPLFGCVRSPCGAGNARFQLKMSPPQAENLVPFFCQVLAELKKLQREVPLPPMHTVQNVP